MISKEEMALLVRDKYDGQAPDLTKDLARLTAGEPLAYVIGWVPFLGLRINLASHPLIPRPETEWWTEVLVGTLKEKGDVRLLDLCAGSGAIGLAVLHEIPHAHVSFGELHPEHCEQIEKNISLNNLDASRASVRAGDLFAPFAEERFDVIVCNPPYIPHDRVLDTNVSHFEPADALFAGSDGLSLIRRIAKETPSHLRPHGELWLECDISHIEEVHALLLENGASSAEIRTDQYGRPRLVVGYYA